MPSLALPLTAIHRYLILEALSSLQPPPRQDEVWRVKRIRDRLQFTAEEAAKFGVVLRSNRGRDIAVGVLSGARYDEVQQETDTMEMASQEDLNFLRDRLPTGAASPVLIDDWIEVLEMVGATPDAPDLRRPPPAVERSAVQGEDG